MNHELCGSQVGDNEQNNLRPHTVVVVVFIFIYDGSYCTIIYQCSGTHS